MASGGSTEREGWGGGEFVMATEGSIHFTFFYVSGSAAWREKFWLMWHIVGLFGLLQSITFRQRILVICANNLLHAIVVSFYLDQNTLYPDLFCQIDMTRQYKTMQTEMGLRVHQLETELERTNKKLGMFNCTVSNVIGIYF